MTDPRAWLDQVDARTNAATNGPWAPWLDQDGAEHMRGLLMVGNAEGVIPDGETWIEGVEVNPIAHTYTDEDRAFIAHARTDLPAATTALRAVLDLHRRIPYGSPALCASAPWVPPFVCEHCLAESDGCVPYPCPTVAAITTALEGFAP